MATRPTWTNVSAAGIDTPDLTKAGELFSSALKGLATTAQQFQTGREQTALSGLERSLRGAKTQEDILTAADPFMARLRDINAAPESLTAAENALRSRQLQVLGQEDIRAEEERLATTLPLIQQAYEKLPEEQKRFLTVDAGGNPLLKTPQEAVKDAQGTVITPAITQQQIDKAAQTFSGLLEEAGVQAPRTDREVLRDIKNQARQFNASPEQVKTLQEQALAFRESEKMLTPQEQQVLTQRETAEDRNLELGLMQLEQQKQSQINTLGYTSGEAQDLLRLKDTDLYALVEGKYPTEISNLNIFRTWSGKKAGIDLKEYIKDTLDKGYKPWEIFLGVQAVGDTEKDWENVDVDQLDEFLESTKGRTTKEDLDLAAFLDTKYEQEKNLLTASSQAAKLRARARTLGERGVRDTAAMRRFRDSYTGAERALQAATDAANANVRTFSVQSPDNIIGTPLNTSPSATDYVAAIPKLTDALLSLFSLLDGSRSNVPQKEQIEVVDNVLDQYVGLDNILSDDMPGIDNIVQVIKKIERSDNPSPAILNNVKVAKQRLRDAGIDIDAMMSGPIEGTIIREELTKARIKRLSELSKEHTRLLDKKDRTAEELDRLEQIRQEEGQLLMETGLITPNQNMLMQNQ